MHEHYPNLKYPPESVIINAIPTEEIKRKSHEKITDFHATDAPVFVSIGRLHTRKGYHKLMEAHARLLQDGFPHTVLILGEGEEMQKLVAQRQKLGVEKSFLLAGNRMNPYPYLRLADYFIMPSESEAWPLVLAEALILQKPAIATNSGDVAAMLKHRETGTLISYDTDEMYTAMKEFLTDEIYINSLRENLKNIETQFDSAPIFRAVEDVFLKLAKK